MSWIPIALFSNSERAQPLRQRLLGAQIPAETHGESPLARMWFVSKREAGVRLMVPGERFEQAEQRLHEWDNQGALREAIRCPECKSLRVVYPQYAEHSVLTNLLVGLAAALGLGEKDYYCEDCHFTWPKHGLRPRRSRPHLAPYYFIEGVEQTTLGPAPSSPAAAPAQEQPPGQTREPGRA
jgi:hypothetical protein